LDRSLQSLVNPGKEAKMIRRWPIHVLAMAGAIACSHDKTTETTVKSPIAAAPSPVATASPPAPETVRPSEGVSIACDLPQEPEEAPRFAYDEAQLRMRGERILDRVARCLSDGPLEGQQVRAIGFADPRGSDAYNLDLGISRAESVQEYLAQNGIPQGRIQLATCGEREANGHDEATWAYDRRVELTLVGEPLPSRQCDARTE
jgi:peptidoglycan-associated lipoprotein